MMPLYNRLTGVGFSHAYFGATRHAITVGFISLMIMGMAGQGRPDPQRYRPENALRACAARSSSSISADPPRHDADRHRLD